MLLLHTRMQIAFKGEYTGIREMRKHAAWYTAGYPKSSGLRRALSEIETYDELAGLLERFGRQLESGK